MSPLVGPVMQPWALAQLFHKHGWSDTENLITIVAVCLAESNGYVNAYHDNVKDGKVLSRDVGLLEINIPADKIGTTYEKELYDPDNNAAAGRKLYVNRGFQPWAAYNSGIALDPLTGGHYIERAIRGVANWAAFMLFQVPNNPSVNPMLYYKGGSNTYSPPK